MSKLKKILDTNGKQGVELYRQSLTNADRVATGDTNKSIRFEVSEDVGSSTLTFYAADHIRNLETGQTPEEFQASKGPDIFQQITRWANAKGVNKSAAGIIRGLELNGYEGTAGVITNVDEEIENNVVNDVKKGSKMLILEQIRISSNGNINN